MIQVPDPSMFPNGFPTDSIPSPKEQLAELKTLSFDELINRIVSDLVEFAVHLTIAILVFYVGQFIIRKIYNVVGTILRRRNVELSLTTFILSLVRIVLYFILIVTVIGIIGINTSSFIAIFASVGVAIGMALSGTLQNFAGGVLILLLKPYKIGDYIEAQGFAGTVTDIQIFSTVICTPDNKSIIIPNGGLSTGTINNWSKQTHRRVQWEIGISYGDDFQRSAAEIHSILRSVKEIVYVDDNGAETENPHATVSAVEAEHAINGVMDDDNVEIVAPTAPEDNKPAEATDGENAVENSVETETKKKHSSWLLNIFRRHRENLRTREAQQAAAIKALNMRKLTNPSVNISTLADSSVNLVVRAWVRRENYWPVYYYVLQQVYSTQSGRSYSFPFPQMDVHLVGNEEEK